MLAGEAREVCTRHGIMRQASGRQFLLHYPELSFSMIMDWRRLVRHFTLRGHHADCRVPAHAPGLAPSYMVPA